MKVSPKTAKVLLIVVHSAAIYLVTQVVFKVVEDTWYYQLPALFVGFFICMYGLMRFRSRYDYLFK